MNSQLFALLSVHILATISPGPDMILITRNSILYSKRVGFATVAGTLAANVVFLLIGVLGLGTAIHQNPQALKGLQFLGGSYLAYSGIRALIRARRAKLEQDCALSNIESVHVTGSMPLPQAFRTGFLTCATNVRAMLYFLGVTTLFLNQTPLAIFKICVILVVSTGMTFGGLAWALGQNAVRKKFETHLTHLDVSTAVLLVFLGSSLLVQVSR